MTAGFMNEAGWRLGVLGWGVVLGACGFPRPLELPEDASVDATLVDVSVTPRCDPTASFGLPVALASINTADDEEYAQLSPNELTLYFSSNRSGSGGYDIFQATRDAISMPFGNVVPVTGVNTAGDERQPSVTADGRSMFALGQPTAGSFRHITLATRMNTTLAFGPLQVVAAVNGTANDSDPYILPAGNALYFTSDREGNYSLYRSARSGEMFATPTIVSGVDLDTAASETTPVISADERTLFFSSMRPGGAGNYDMYEASRATVLDGFGAPLPLTDLNTETFEAPNWLSADGCDLYFTRGVVNGQNGQSQLYMTTRGR